MRRSIFVLAAIAAIAVGSTTAAHAQTPDISVDPSEPAPGAPVTVTVTGAPPGEPVVVRLGVQQQSTTVDASGTATVTITAPNEPGDALGTVNVGIVDYPITVTVQVAATTTTTTTTTTVPPPPPAQPVTGLDDTATLVALAAVLLAAGLGLSAVTRRPIAAIVTKGSVTHYRIIDDRHSSGESVRRR